MATEKKKKESQLDIIARGVAEIKQNMAQNMATKKDLANLETRLTNKIDKVQESVESLDKKLIEDTGAMTGVEQTHNRSLVQRVARLEKKVFPKTA